MECFGTFWDVFEHFLDILYVMGTLGAFWGILRCFGDDLGCSWDICGCFWTFWYAFGEFWNFLLDLLERIMTFWDVLGSFF